MLHRGPQPSALESVQSRLAFRTSYFFFDILLNLVSVKDQFYCYLALHQPLLNSIKLNRIKFSLLYTIIRLIIFRIKMRYTYVSSEIPYIPFSIRRFRRIFSQIIISSHFPPWWWQISLSLFLVPCKMELFQPDCGAFLTFWYLLK